ncbi:MAG: LON peptidase substrate-binding domain-containing protein [Gammaproteobacteria bacterium]
MLKSLPIFPLGIVVLPGNIQSLQIFEPRYIQMVKDCMKADSGFVIVLQKESKENQLSILEHGTYVEIIDFNTLPNGLLGITVRGIHRTKIKTMEQNQLGLNIGTVENIQDPEVDDQALLAQYPDLIQVLSQLKQHPQIKSMPLEINLDSADSVSYHLAGLIPLAAKDKQKILEAFDAGQRLNYLSKYFDQIAGSKN